MAFNRVLNAVANVMAIASGSTQGTSYAVTTGNPILVDCAWHLWMHLAFSVCVVDFIVMYKKKIPGNSFWVHDYNIASKNPQKNSNGRDK